MLQRAPACHIRAEIATVSNAERITCAYCHANSASHEDAVSISTCARRFALYGEPLCLGQQADTRSPLLPLSSLVKCDPESVGLSSLNGL